jgi:hypothetical protein
VYPESPPKQPPGLPAHVTVLWQRRWWAELLHNVWRPAGQAKHEFKWRCSGATLRVVRLDCEIQEGVACVQPSQDLGTWIPLAQLSNTQALDGSTHTITLESAVPYGLLPTLNPTRCHVVNANPTARMSPSAGLKGEFLREVDSSFLEHCEQRLPPLYGWSSKKPDDLVALDLPVCFEDICEMQRVPQFALGHLDAWDAICWDNRHTCFAA